jgi:hypothetical protein
MKIRHPLLLTVGLLTCFRIAWYFLFFNYLTQASWARHIFADLAGWTKFFKKISDGSIPYVDFHREYPPLAGYFFFFLEKIIPSIAENFSRKYFIIMGVVDTLSMVLLAAIVSKLQLKHPILALVFFQINLTALIFSPVRFDGLLVLAMLAGYYLYISNRLYWALSVWGLGFCIKWYTVFIFLAVIFRNVSLTPRNFGELFRRGMAFTLPIILVHLPLLTLEYLRHGTYNEVIAPLTFHLHRPLAWDTVAGMLRLMYGTIPFERYLDKISLILILCVIFFKYYQSLAAKIVLSCCAMLFINRVYSPQFNLWFYPFLLLILADIPRCHFLLALFLLLDLINICVFPLGLSYAARELQGLSPAKLFQGGWASFFFATVVFLRAAVICALLAILFKHARQRKDAEYPGDFEGSERRAVL